MLSDNVANILMRSVLLCLVAVFLAGCASVADQTVRHYRGVVLDLDSRAPVGNIVLTACSSPRFNFNPDGAPIRVGSTLSGKDGSFDIAVPVGKRGADMIEAMAGAPWIAQGFPRKGNLCGYDGTLYRISESRQNIVLIKKAYYQSDAACR